MRTIAKLGRVPSVASAFWFPNEELRTCFLRSPAFWGVHGYWTITAHFSRELFEFLLICFYKEQLDSALFIVALIISRRSGLCIVSEIQITKEVVSLKESSLSFHREIQKLMKKFNKKDHVSPNKALASL